MRIMPRVLLLLFALSALTLMFIIKCGVNIDSHLLSRDDAGALLSLTMPGKEYYEEVLHKQRSQHDGQVGSLQARIAELEGQLQDAKKLLNHSKHFSLRSAESEANYKNRVLFYDDFFSQKLRDSEITHGVPLHNEYEVIPFCRFTLNRIYLVDPGMGKRVVEKPIGFKKKDLHEVVQYAVEKLNLDRKDSEAQYTVEDFREGIYRTEPSMGTHYELHFKNLDMPDESGYQTVILSRPFGPIHLVSSQAVNPKKETINIILPLAGRTEKFQGFMDRFVRVCIHNDKHVFLTVVYFGTDGLNEVKNILGKVSKKFHFKNMKLVTLNEGFSRGRGLQVGSQSWTKGDVVLFLCDVDIVFNNEFLDRCRLNTERGKMVYYPMVFSLYNPTVVYSLHNLDVPQEEDQLIISKDTGFWRDFGFGMTCQYRSDFMNIKGFDEQIVGWGMEDVLLYRKYVKSDLMVVRATDPGIFHLWHSKHCNPDLPWEQYRGCIRSKALNEASHAQLGMLAFKEEVDLHHRNMLLNMENNISNNNHNNHNNDANKSKRQILR